jgi:CRISPR-associated protein Cas2
MRKKDFLICYDIADKRRLSKIAKLVEANALRIQRSVYFYEGASKKELTSLIDKVVNILDEKADDLRIYTIKNKGIHLGEAIDLNNPFILI